ncbi:hypothetical protein HFP15_32420 [Amycolatopsis sp. K13G38]|uniref:Uncharacterized protein n=1 Tax=Amycolatopsis acididurans TaxID=2724524 RepID=A0ABX1JD39_9PSEU|nr:hypothetical protein [Amycolatopsis acididurans]NKQ57578.1 hypothetical protein [Amycolatopsis acididurans]
MSRRVPPGQLGLFADQLPGGPAPASSRACPPVRTGRKPARAPVTPSVARDVLAEVQDGCFGLLDDSDRVVLFEDTDRVRVAIDEDTVHTLITGGYVERSPARETVSCLHGAIRRPVSPLRLTKSGRSLLNRWSSLKTY